MRAFLFIGVMLMMFVAGLVLLLGKNIELVATTAVPISAEPTIDPQTVQAIAVLKPGERVAVSSCKDLKHYSVPEVRLQDGRRGYVMGGQFALATTAPKLSLDKPIVFSCS